MKPSFSITIAIIALMLAVPIHAVSDHVKNNYGSFNAPEKWDNDDWSADAGFPFRWNAFSIKGYRDGHDVKAYEDAANSGKLFLPIEYWEYQVCTRALSTQLDQTVGASVGGGIYDDAYTVQAFRQNGTDNNYLYEVAWYIQPKPVKDDYGQTREGVYYNITIMNGDKTLTIGGRRGVTFQQGDSGFSAFYDVEKYDKIVLSYYGVRAEFSVIDK